MSFSAIKREARSALHSVLAEPCTCDMPDGTSYPSAEQSAGGLRLTARFASKLKTHAPLDGGDGLAVLEPIERLVFQTPQLEALGLTLVQGAVIHMVGYGLSFVLDQPLDPDGPLNEYWTVTRWV